jgi:hypothetical protein
MLFRLGECYFAHSRSGLPLSQIKRADLMRRCALVCLHNQAKWRLSAFRYAVAINASIEGITGTNN